MTPAFDHPVPSGGYAWWYMDALSDDGCHGITVIAFVGSVFSPYYALARRRSGSAADPLNHCALNVALYRRAGAAAATGWAMTERSREAVQRSPMRLQIGPSALQWQRDSLHVTIDETMVPWPRRLVGTLRLQAPAMLSQRYALDSAGQHHWCPIAPCAQVEVDLQQPRMRWRGSGYLDANFGQRSLEQDFRSWDWSRSTLDGQRSAVLYDVVRRDGSENSLALAFDPVTGARAFEPPARQHLPASGWRVARATRADHGSQPQLVQTLEDGPFYVRSVLRTQVDGVSAHAVHESLSLQRFSAGWVQLMLPFRMPRRPY